MKTIKIIVALMLCLSLTASLCGCSFLSFRRTDKHESTAENKTDADGRTAADAGQTADDAETDAPQEENVPDPRVEEILSGMSLEEKVAQMFIVTPSALTDYEGSLTETGETAKSYFDNCPVGGIIYLGESLQSTEQTKTMISAMQEISVSRIGLPAFICVDEEGGEVARVSGTGKFDGVGSYRSMCYVGADEDEEKAYEIGAEMGDYLSDLGFNVDFAPVADVLTNENNTVVKYRSFGSDPQLVTKMTRSFATGLMSKGVLATYKHFPGHGATSEDSHKGFAISYRTKDELRATELVPFVDGVSLGVPFIMVGHITLPNVTEDDLPASLSKEIVTGLLRGELGYTGLVITDAMNMGAIADNYSDADAAVMAVEAGNDIILLADDLDAYYQAVLDAVASEKITEERINESVRRIISAKLRYLQQTDAPAG